MITDYALYWKMDENSGNLVDSSGNSHTGTVTGTTSVDGKIFKGRLLNGSTDFISSSFTSSSLMTICFWVKITSIVSTDNIGVMFWNGTTVSGYLGAIITGATANDIRIVKSNVAHFRSNTAITSLLNTGWRHIAFVIDKSSAAGSRIHIDGIEITYNQTADQTFNADTGFNLNHFIVGADSRFSPGTLDDFRIYNRLLSNTEIHQVYTFSYSKFNNSGLRPRPFAPCLAR